MKLQYMVEGGQAYLAQNERQNLWISEGLRVHINAHQSSGFAFFKLDLKYLSLRFQCRAEKHEETGFLVRLLLLALALLLEVWK